MVSFAGRGFESLRLHRQAWLNYLGQAFFIFRCQAINALTYYLSFQLHEYGEAQESHMSKSKKARIKW